VDAWVWIEPLKYNTAKEKGMMEVSRGGCPKSGDFGQPVEGFLVFWL
jgi:hypothetical protein